MLELIRYISLNTDIQINLVLMDDEIHYDYIHQWKIPITILKRKNLKKDPRIFWKFYSYCKNVRPDIIHAWSFMTTFYAIPTKIVLKIPLLSSMIASGNSQLKPGSLDKFYFKMNCVFSDIIFSNSKAGLVSGITQWVYSIWQWLI